MHHPIIHSVALLVYVKTLKGDSILAQTFSV